jgi:hypothetical protein
MAILIEEGENLADGRPGFSFLCSTHAYKASDVEQLFASHHITSLEQGLDRWISHEAQFGYAVSIFVIV